MPSAHWIGVGSFRIVKASGPPIADSRQNAIERLHIVAIRYNMPRLRQRGRNKRCQRQKNCRNRAPEHGLLYRFRNERRMNGATPAEPTRSRHINLLKNKAQIVLLCVIIPTENRRQIERSGRSGSAGDAERNMRAAGA
jgi:hypothetical protein